MARFKGVVLGVVAVMAVSAAAIAGQGWENGGDCCKGREGRSARMGDPAKAESLAGQVVTVHPAGSGKDRGQGVVVTVKGGAEDTIVHLGPSWYLEQQTVKIAAGDAVEIKGAKVHRRGQDIFLAYEVKKGGEILKLRDDQGAPAWSGSRCNNRQGV